MVAERLEQLPSVASGEAPIDVLICGGGLAGLLMARQLRRELPELRVAVVERSERPLPEACHKVGESSVELGSQYLEELGLTDYLHEHQLLKFGLRFFPGGGHLPLEQRTEIGPAFDPIVRSYQVDRGRLEEDLRGMVQEDGAELVEGVTVRDLEIGRDETPHHVTVEGGSEARTVPVRWLVDATGRNALLRRRLKLTRGANHPASASWFRVDERVAPGDLVPDSAHDWHGVDFADKRWLSTNHLMGHGYWVWLIPLPGGRTSIGVVVHGETHGFDEIRTLERTRNFLREHEPVLARRLDELEALDFRCLRDYSYGIARSWSTDRWALVGEAGAFVDPLYSQGTDFIAFTNAYTAELMRVDRDGEDLHTRTRELNIQYRSLVSGALGILRPAGPIYGHPRAMAAKIYWDNFSYWSFPCQYYLQGLYRLTGKRHQAFTMLGRRFVELSDYVQALLREWALMAPEEPDGRLLGMPGYPSLLVDAHLAMTRSMTPDQTYAYMQDRAADAEAIVAELVLRIVQELGPERGRELLERAGVADWDLRFDPDRLAAEELSGVARRKALGSVARDVERSLGRIHRRSDAAEARRLLGTPAPEEARASR